MYNSCIIPKDPHPVIFESLDTNVICAAALSASRDLCTSLASVAIRISTSYVYPSSIAPLLACRLIALNKHPGVCPIGTGDKACIIITKAVLSITKPDIQDASGCQQMCDGQISGIEGVVHRAHQAFDSAECEATVLIDATNAFNSLSCQVALHNIRCLSPPIATILVNSYRAPSKLFVDCDVILSQEGTAQGNPLAMAMYGLATIPLIRRLNGSYTNKSGTVMTPPPLPPLNIYAVTPNDQECAIFASPAQHGGLGIRIPSKKELQSFQLVTSSLVSHILEQNQEYGYDDIADQLQSKATFRNQNKEMSSKEADNLYSHLPARLQKAMDLTKEKGASTWLTALPLKEHGFLLHRAASMMPWRMVSFKSPVQVQLWQLFHC